MFTIPFAFTGRVPRAGMTSTPLSLIALIGAIMLVGIVTKNGIVMVDYMNLLVERGSGVFDAVIAGGKSRLRPVLMTSFTTILGMLPLAIGTGAGSGDMAADGYRRDRRSDLFDPADAVYHSCALFGIREPFPAQGEGETGPSVGRTSGECALIKVKRL